MAALVCHEDGTLVVEQVPVPEPGPGDVLLRISHCGICGTDLHWVSGRPAHGPIVLGHEYSGVVVALGRDVTGWAVGDRVGGGPGLGCRPRPPGPGGGGPGAGLPPLPAVPGRHAAPVPRAALEGRCRERILGDLPAGRRR